MPKSTTPVLIGDYYMNRSSVYKFSIINIDVNICNITTAKYIQVDVGISRVREWINRGLYYHKSYKSYKKLLK